jgi:glycosyltransferase involved in cell wall biosynthesis
MTDVTVIVATHDRPAMLEVELHSILASAAMVTAKVRVLVVDDCSETTAAKSIAKRLGVDYMRLPENRGIAGTLFAGFEASDRPFTSFWGDDDYMLPRYLPLHLGKIAEGFDVVSSSYYQTNAELKITRDVILPLPTMPDLLAGRVTANDGSLIRRTALEGIPWRPERERAMLMTMWLALVSAGRRFATLTEPTWLYRRHGSNMSSLRRRDEHDMSLRREAIAEYRR